MKTEIVCELSNAHNQDFDRCIRLIDAAQHAGADAVKFQCFTPEELVELRGDGPAPEPWGSQGWTMRSLYAKAQTPHEWFPELVGHCNRIGMPWFSSVFGLESLALLESLGCPRYKLASLDYQKGGDAFAHMWSALTNTGKTLVASSPFVSAIPKMGMRFLYCPPSYPQTEFHLQNIRNGYHGFSYHGTDGEVPVIAVAAGARMIEVHFQLAAEPSELEANVSLNEYQFEQMVHDIRRVEGMLA